MDIVVWYSDHDLDGELIMALRPERNCQKGIIYSRKMLAERLRCKMNPDIEQELELGPLGYIDPSYYHECGITVTPPAQIRKLANVSDAKLNETVNEIVTTWIAQEWTRRTKNRVGLSYAVHG